MIKKLLLGLFFGVFMAIAPAYATDTYFCSCDSGAEGGCIAGNDTTGNGSIGTPYKTIGSHLNVNLPAGDRHLYCKGGAWAAGGGSWSGWNNTGSTATETNPFIFQNYQAGWGGVGRPIFNFTSQTAFNLSSNVDHFGLVIRDLHLVGPSNTVSFGDTTGIFLYANFHNTRVINMEIEGFYYGIETPQGGFGITEHSDNLYVGTGDPYGGTAALPASTSGMYIHGNFNGGMFISVANTLLENTYFDFNGACGGNPTGGGCQSEFLRHSFYVGGADDGTTRNIVARGNISTRVGYARGFCSSTHITGHGLVYGLVYENNYAFETTTSDGHCYGIGYGDNYQQAGEACTNCVFRGNLMVNLGTNYMPVNTGPWIVENNVGIITTGSANCIFVEPRNRATSGQTTNVIVRNNSCYYFPGTGGTAITYTNVSELDGGTSTGTGNIVNGNLVYIAGGSAACWFNPGKLAADFFFDTNLCRQLGSGAGYQTNTPTAPANNPNGLNTNPLLRNTPASGNNWDMQITATSPAIGAATQATAAKTAIHGYPKVGNRDIGAYEFGSNP